VRSKRDVQAQIQADTVELRERPAEARGVTELRQRVPDKVVSEQADEFTVVGKSIPRVEGYDKVTGRAQFTDDIDLHGLVYAQVLKSTIAHGKIKRIDTGAAEKLPGVLVVFTGKDCPTPYSVNNLTPTETALAVDKVRYFGEGVAAVVALDEKTAAKATRLIKVDYEELPPLVNAREAAVQTDNLIHDYAENNINHVAEQAFGDVPARRSSRSITVTNCRICCSTQYRRP
jgi:4-hydroxybenzoyl-CoA reductase subunit alpha